MSSTKKRRSSQFRKDWIPAWRNKTSDGDDFVTFTMNGERYAMFWNRQKTAGSNQPDFRIVLSRSAAS